MAKITFDSRGSGPLRFLSGANHYRFIGLEITRDSPGAVTYDPVGTEEKGTSDHIIFDRVWLHVRRKTKQRGASYLQVDVTSLSWTLTSVIFIVWRSPEPAEIHRQLQAASAISQWAHTRS